MERLLNPIDRTDIPLKIFHIDHVGPTKLTKKQYNHIVNAFSYPTKSTDADKVVDRLQK